MLEILLVPFMIMVLILLLLRYLFQLKITYTASWLLYTLLAFKLENETMLGLCASSGLTNMIGWYTLRMLDRSMWKSMLLGWFGIWANIRPLQLLARCIDVVVHIVCPFIVFVKYGGLVKPWMGIVLISWGRCWCWIMLNSWKWSPPADGVYRFEKNRSKQFWNAAYKLQFMLDVMIPMLCCLDTDRWVVLKRTVMGCMVLFIAQLFRSYLRPVLQGKAKEIMTWLLLQGEIRIGQDIVVHDDAMWLDWMTNGMLAIGESYTAKQWDNGNTNSLNQIVIKLLTLPAAARRQMFHSWEARMVSLVARLMHYKSSCAGRIVGTLEEQFKMSKQFVLPMRDTNIHPSFAIWDQPPNASNRKVALETAQCIKCTTIYRILQLEQTTIEPIHILDITFRGYGGLGYYLAERNPNVHVTCIVNSIQDKQDSMQNRVNDRVIFIIATVQDILENNTLPSTLPAATYNKIISIGYLEKARSSICIQNHIFDLKALLAPHGQLYVEYLGSSTTQTISSSLMWSNYYIYNLKFIRPNISLETILNSLKMASITVNECSSFNQAAEYTHLVWYQLFRSKYQHNTVSRNLKCSVPESLERTYEFYLLHTAACLNAGTASQYQLVASV